MLSSPLVRSALKVAAHAHRSAVRKGTDIPYIAHPVAVLLVLAEVDGDEITLAAGVLHDVVEDAGVEYPQERLRLGFGDEVTDTVMAVTKDSTIREWRSRNEQYLVKLRESGNERAWMVSAADKISNLTDILEDYAEIGDNLWSRFNAGKQAQLWWYGAVADEVTELLPGHVLARRLQSLVDQLRVIMDADPGSSTHAAA